MSFVKIFEQIYDSSIAEDWHVRVVFQDMLILANKDGIVDRTPEAIARRTNVPLETVLEAIPRLEAGDPASRTPDEDGRRIVRLDAHRNWGWRIVNYQKYRESATKDMLRMAEADRKRAYRAKFGGKPQTPTTTTKGTKTEEDIEEEADMSMDMSRTKDVLGALYKRPANEAWSYAEECALIEIRRRVNFAKEIEEVKAFQPKPRSFFPQSLARLLADWPSVLDRARSYRNDEPAQQQPRISDLKAVLEAKKAQRQRIYNRGHENALGFTARNQQDADDLKELNKEISKLIDQIGATKV